MRLLRAAQLSQLEESLAHSHAALYVKNYEAHRKALLGNVTTEMALLDTGTHQFPVSINDCTPHPENCYVVSPMTAYSGYAQDEVRRLKRPSLERPLGWLLRVITALLESIRLDRIVQINNWLLSTNLYPSRWDGNNLPEITNFFASEFPDHAFGFRSLNPLSNSPLIQRLNALGYTAVPSRQVYIFDGRQGNQSPFLSHHNTRMDASLLRRKRYRILRGNSLKDEDFKRMEQLYNQLYLNKYCRLNPHYKAEWLRSGQRDGWLELRVLQSPEGRVDGVLGWFATDTTLSAPIVGYDTTLPKQTGLYRQLTQLCLQEAAARRVVLNFSSGAAHFKRLRGGQPQIEWSMVYVKHLPIYNRIVWKLLGGVLKMVGVPLMRALKL